MKQSIQNITRRIIKVLPEVSPMLLILPEFNPLEKSYDAARKIWSSQEMGELNLLPGSWVSPEYSGSYSILAITGLLIIMGTTLSVIFRKMAVKKSGQNI